MGHRTAPALTGLAGEDRSDVPGRRRAVQVQVYLLGTGQFPRRSPGPEGAHAHLGRIRLD